MEIDNPREFEPVPIPIRMFNRRNQQTNRCPYVVAKNAAISFKMSVSLLYVSSKPGVSTRSTRCPSRVNSLASWTSAVQDLKSDPMRRSEPLPLLMSCRPRVSLQEQSAFSNSQKSSHFPLHP